MTTPLQRRWVMTSRTSNAPWLLTFYIGGAVVAEISFLDKTVVKLDMWRRDLEFFNQPHAVSQAMTRMHEVLLGPPES
jgi:hypothetical protein